MLTEDVKITGLAAAKQRVRAKAEAKTLAKDVMAMLMPMIRDEVQKVIKEEAESLRAELRYRDTTLVSAKELGGILGMSYDNIRKMDKSHLPQVHLNPGGTRYIKELIVAAIAQQ